MPISKELVSNAEAVASQQICHEKGRGRVYTAGLDPEVFADNQNRFGQRHTNGGAEAQRLQMDYHGGDISAIDIIDGIDQ